MSEIMVTIIGRVMLIPLLVGFIIVVWHRIDQVRYRISRIMMIRMILSCILMLISVLCAIPKPVTWWMHVGRIAALHYSLVFSLLVGEHLLQDRPFISLRKYPIFYIGTVVLSIVLSIDYFRRDNLGILTDNDIFKLDYLYIISYIINYTFLLILSTGLFLMSWRAIQKDRPLTYRLRRGMFVIGFAVASLCTFSVLVNIVLLVLHYDMYKLLLNDIYHGGKPIYFSFNLLGLILPEGVFAWLSRPLIPYQTRRQQHEYELISYFYGRISQITPNIQLNYGAAHLEDMLIEIADARLLIWSRQPYRWWFRPKHEAQLLFHLLRTGERIEIPGDYQLPRQHLKELRYTMAVARQLQRLERKAGVTDQYQEYTT